MEFEKKYASATEKDKIENKDKTILSDDAYALGEIIDALIKKLEHIKQVLLK